MRRLLFVLVGCGSAPAPVVPPHNVVRAPIELTSTHHKDMTLIGASALTNGDLVIAAETWQGLAIAGQVQCATEHDRVVVARLAGDGTPRWVRCLDTDPERDAIAVADDTGVWFIHHAASTLQGDAIHPIVVVDRFAAADGKPLGSRPLVVFQGGMQYTNSVGGNVQIKSAIVAGGELIVAGSSLGGKVTNDAWNADLFGDLQGFVLGLSDHVRTIYTEPKGVIESVAAAGSRLAIAGWDGGGSLNVFVVHASLAANAPLVRHELGDRYGPKVAIDREGNVIAAAASWQPFTVDGRAVSSTCAEFAFVASWAPAGTLRYVRALGDCKQPTVGPFHDDDISDHSIEVASVSLRDDDPVIAIDIREDTNHLAWPVHFGPLSVPVPFANAIVLATLDARGTIARHRLLRFAGEPPEPDQPDASLAHGAGIHRVIATGAWTVLEHAGGLEAGGTRVSTRSWLRLDKDDMRYVTDDTRGECDPRAIHATPTDQQIIAGDGEPEDGGCRTAVHVETAITVIPS